jgi:hypothetical protein
VPLPSREESVRQIREEAAKKQAELNQLGATKQAEYRAFRQSERVKFRDELRDVLDTHGNLAGPEIDLVAKRYSYDVDRQKFLRAHNSWKSSRSSIESKIRFTRSLGLPEPAILNLLSDELVFQIGTREGPRNRNDVRIRAARMLLKSELPAADSIDNVSPPDNPEPNPDRSPQRATPGRVAGSRTR